MAIILNPTDPFLEKSYITPEWADDYFAYDMNATAWIEEADIDIKKKALVMATREIDSHCFRGVKQDPNQPLQFPRLHDRSYQILTDIQLIKYADRLGDHVTNVPDAIRKAVCEQALYILQQHKAPSMDTQDMAKLKANGVSSYAIGDVSVSFNSTPVTPEPLCNKAYGYISPFIKRYGRLV